MAFPRWLTELFRSSGDPAPVRSRLVIAHTENESSVERTAPGPLDATDPRHVRGATRAAPLAEEFPRQWPHRKAHAQSGIFNHHW